MSLLKKRKATTNKKYQGKEINPVLFNSGHAKREIYFLTETSGFGELNYIKKYMSTNHPLVGYEILSVFGLKIQASEVSRSPSAFYFKNGLDMSKYIPSCSKVIPIGRAMMGVTFDSSVKVEGFYDSTFQETHFYAPKLSSQIFPVDAGYKWYSSKDRKSLDNFYRKFLKDQIERAVAFTVVPRRLPPTGMYTVTDVNAWMLEHWNKTICAWDLETSSLDYQRGYILCLTMSFDGKDAYYLRFKDIKDLAMFDDFMENKYSIGANLKFDIKFMFSQYRFKNLKVDFDTMQAGHILNEMSSQSLKTHAWKYTPYGGYDEELERYKFKYPKLKSYADIPEPMLKTYALMDAKVTFLIYEKFKAMLEREPELYEYFFRIVMPFVQIYPQIEFDGVFIDWDMVRTVGQDFTKRIQDVEEEMYKIFGRINFNGDEFAKKLEALGWSDQGRDSFDLFNINKNTVKEWIEQGYEGAELIEKRSKLVTAQGTFVGLEETGKGFWKYRGTDDKIHPNFLVNMANSHRNKCNNPNLQNYPKHGVIASLIRKCFSTLDDNTLISECDYDSLQAKICACLSKDETMRDVFLNRGGDLHSITGHSVFFAIPKKFIGVRFENGEEKEYLESDYKGLKDSLDSHSTYAVPDRLVTLEEFLDWKKSSKTIKSARQKSKAINFGNLFGGTKYGMCFNTVMPNWTPRECYTYIIDMKLQMPKMSGKENGNYSDKILKSHFQDLALVVAEDIHTKFFNTYSGLVPWIGECHKEARENGYIRTVHGARRLLPQLTYIGTDTDRKEVSSWENIAVNSRVQNFEVAVVGRAMVGIFNDFKNNNMKSSVYGMIHDAINMYIDKDEMVEAYDIIKKNMEVDFPEYQGLFYSAEADIAYPRHPQDDKKTFWGSSPVWEGETFNELYPELVA